MVTARRPTSSAVLLAVRERVRVRGRRVLFRVCRSEAAVVLQEQVASDPVGGPVPEEDLVEAAVVVAVIALVIVKFREAEGRGALAPGPLVALIEVVHPPVPAARAVHRALEVAAASGAVVVEAGEDKQRGQK